MTSYRSFVYLHHKELTNTLKLEIMTIQELRIVGKEKARKVVMAIVFTELKKEDQQPTKENVQANIINFFRKAFNVSSLLELTKDQEAEMNMILAK